MVGLNPTGGMDVSLVVSVVCCQVEVSATSWSFVQRSPTDWCVVVCDLDTSWMRRPWSTGGCRAKNTKQNDTYVRRVIFLPCCKNPLLKHDTTTRPSPLQNMVGLTENGQAWRNVRYVGELEGKGGGVLAVGPFSFSPFRSICQFFVVGLRNWRELRETVVTGLILHRL